MDFETDKISYYFNALTNKQVQRMAALFQKENNLGKNAIRLLNNLENKLRNVEEVVSSKK